MTYEPGYVEESDFPRSEEPVWILGKEYTAKGTYNYIIIIYRRITRHTINLIDMK
jgi:hypothetical protein